MSRIVSSSSHTADGTTSPLMKKVFGWSAKENAGAAASITLTNGNGGTALVHINLAANETANMNYGDAPVFFSQGAWVDEVSGDVTIVVHGTIN